MPVFGLKDEKLAHLSMDRFECGHASAGFARYARLMMEFYLNL
jgi:hypothetical protein